MTMVNMNSFTNYLSYDAEYFIEEKRDCVHLC